MNCKCLSTHTRQGIHLDYKYQSATIFTVNIEFVPFFPHKTIICMLLNARNGKMDEIWIFNVIDILLFRKKTHNEHYILHRGVFCK